MFNRGLNKFGFPPFLAYVLLSICFVGLSNYLFSKSEFAEYIYVLLAFGLLTKLTDKKEMKDFTVGTQIEKLHIS